jgi:hypothetical protein
LFDKNKKAAGGLIWHHLKSLVTDVQSNAPFCHSKTKPRTSTTRKSTKAKKPLKPVLTPDYTQGYNSAASKSNTKN